MSFSRAAPMRSAPRRCARILGRLPGRADHVRHGPDLEPLRSRVHDEPSATKALAYTYDPETFAVYSKQMRRWASGFFQNFQSPPTARCSSSPSALPGRRLAPLRPLDDAGDLHQRLPPLGAPRSFEPSLARRRPSPFTPQSQSSSRRARSPGSRPSSASPATRLANWWNKTIYLWTFIREWILGRHYTSWTGRQGRADRDHADE